MLSFIQEQAGKNLHMEHIEDEIINHADLLKYAEEYTLDTFTVIPHLSIQ